MRSEGKLQQSAGALRHSDIVTAVSSGELCSKNNRQKAVYGWLSLVVGDEHEN